VALGASAPGSAAQAARGAASLTTSLNPAAIVRSADNAIDPVVERRVSGPV
jgi:hypothetical protein